MPQNHEFKDQFVKVMPKDLEKSIVKPYSALREGKKTSYSSQNVSEIESMFAQLLILRFLIRQTTGPWPEIY